MMTNEEHIEGLKGIKPFLQKKMREINYQGMGELDAKEIGETIDKAIEEHLKDMKQMDAMAVLLSQLKSGKCRAPSARGIIKITGGRKHDE